MTANAPAPPETTEGASTSAPCEICQLEPHSPCDVDKLTVKVTGQEVGPKSPVTRELSITSSHRRSEPIDIPDAELRRMLRQDYDFVIDTIAEANAPTFPAKLGAKISAKANYHGRSCSTESHAELSLEPLGLAPELDGKTEISKVQPGASVLELPETTIFAPTCFIDRLADHSGDNPYDSVTNVFGIITMLWDMKNYKTVDVTARSCGVRAKEDRRAANDSLRGAVRIFRRSKLAAGIAIPALGSFTRERTGDVLSGDRTQTTAMTAGAGLFGSTTSSAQKADGTFTHTGTQQLGGTVTEHVLEGKTGEAGTTTTGFSERRLAQGVESGSTYGTVTRADIQDKLARASGFEVVLSHNGTEVKALDAIEKLGQLIEEIGKALTDIQNLFNSAPQLGWKFTFEVSVFSGTIVLEWAPEYIAAPQANGRYLAVQWKLQGKLEIQIFNISVSASFGIDARAAGSGIVVKIVGTLNGSARVSTNLNLDLFKPRQEIEVETEANAALAIVGHASIFGRTLADAELKGSGGIELVDGVLDVRWDLRTCDLRGKIQSKPVIITGYVRGWLWDSELDPITVMERKDLYEFK